MVRTTLLGAQGRSLVGELRSYKPGSVAKKKKKKSICNTGVEDSCVFLIQEYTMKRF